MPQSSRPIDIARGIIFDPVKTGFESIEVQSAIDELNAIVAQGANATAQGTWLISGGGVAWVSGYTYRVSAAQYYIAGIAHTSPQAQVILSPPDVTFGRFDVIAVDNTGSVIVLEGTPAVSPELPDVDPQTQLTLTIVQIDIGTTEPEAIASKTIYAENVGAPDEWILTTSAGTIILGSTTNPYSGTKCIEATGAANGTYLEGTVSPAIIATESQNLVMYLRPKTGWPTQKSLSISFRTSSSLVGNVVSVSNGFFGFNSTNITIYQQIVVPITQFNLPAGTTATKVRIAITGGGSGVGFYLDDISLQGGVTDPGVGATGLTMQQGDARYAQRGANLSDLVSASIARINLGLEGVATLPITTQGDLIAGGPNSPPVLPDIASTGTPSVIGSNNNTTPNAGIAANVIDGSDATFCQANNGGVCNGSRVRIDFGVGINKQIAGFRVLQVSPGTDFHAAATGLVLESSPDAVAWTPRHTIASGLGADTGFITSTLQSSARYWQVRAISTGISGWIVYTLELYAGSGVGPSPTRLPVGTNGQVLVVDSAQLLGIKWATLAAPTTFRFGASGIIAIGQKTPTHRVRAAGTAFQLDMTLSAGTATASIEASTDGGVTWPTTVGTVIISTGKVNTATISTALAIGTLLRINYTAATGAVDPVVTLYVQ